MYLRLEWLAAILLLFLPAFQIREETYEEILLDWKPLSASRALDYNRIKAAVAAAPADKPVQWAAALQPLLDELIAGLRQDGFPAGTAEGVFFGFVNEANPSFDESDLVVLLNGGPFQANLALALVSEANTGPALEQASRELFAATPHSRLKTGILNRFHHLNNMALVHELARQALKRPGEDEHVLNECAVVLMYSSVDEPIALEALLAYIRDGHPWLAPNALHYLDEYDDHEEQIAAHGDEIARVLLTALDRDLPHALWSNILSVTPRLYEITGDQRIKDKLRELLELKSWDGRPKRSPLPALEALDDIMPANQYCRLLEQFAKEHRQQIQAFGLTNHLAIRIDLCNKKSSE